MAKKSKFHCKSEAQKRAIRRSYAERADKENKVGKVYRGETKYIDVEPKKQRDYVVVREKGKNVTVAKLKTVKKFDANGKNADPALVEINHERYGLPNRTGVDFQRFDRNRISGKPLDIEDKTVFPEGKEQFTLGSNDTHNALVHTGMVLKKPKKKK
ncbi:MAG: hypothetical protein NC184_01950 [Roseburia sp.]|nr:hypothetical protein [Roseburia sp.]